MNSIPKLLRFLFVVTLLPIGFASQVQADLVTFGNGFGSKWGDPNHGTASDVITWTFMDDATLLHSTHPLLVSGEVLGNSTSNITSLRSTFDAANGPGKFDQAIENAFATWAAAAPGRITFLKVGADTGAPAGGNSNNNFDAGSYVTDIRIGAFAPVAATNFAGIGAVGYGPPGNDTNPNFRDALAGDIILNLSGAFFVAPGNEGDQFYFGGAYTNDLENLVLHELGHAAIGLGHSTDGPNFPGVGDVMFVDKFPDAFNFVNRQLSGQDIAGAQIVYGVPEPGSIALFSIGIAMLGMSRRRRLM